MSPNPVHPMPQNHRVFDPWNSSATGHQRSDSSTGTAWRRTREDKLARQFRSASGDCRASITHESGDERKGEWVWCSSTKKSPCEADPRQRDIRSLMSIGKRARADDPDSECREKLKVSKVSGVRPVDLSQSPDSSSPLPRPSTGSVSVAPKETPQIFKGITVYVNSTYHPEVSDHHLKRLLTTYGAQLSLSSSRKVSHVIVGKPNAGPGKGAGGGLAASKLQVIARGGWKGLKVVFVEWVLESIKAQKRLSEAKFAMDIVSNGQRSVLSFC
ncbi:hypothetical protein BDV25DRAFT_171412 [Aspergillus avenaceus]|uniref:BRCT domain-containing protein n=1 Tax=Aspergillus avenaceus TaxID=36643 RepID=A0A5N6TEC9_ASPAV|nr:hypothetical protein BDV25DRAFT_171412 [Aspergillus avenaceus]